MTRLTRKKDGRQVLDVGGAVCRRPDGTIRQVFVHGEGRKKFHESQWYQDTIPDFQSEARPWYASDNSAEARQARKEYLEYFHQYGREAAVLGLKCCAMSQGLWHNAILHEDRYPPAELRQKFQEVFGERPACFMEPLRNMFGAWRMDAFKFERWLVDQHGYDMQGVKSIYQHVRKVFGQKAVNVLKEITEWKPEH